MNGTGETQAFLLRTVPSGMAIVSVGETRIAARVRVPGPFEISADTIAGTVGSCRFVPYYPDLSKSKAEACVVPLERRARANLWERMRLAKSGFEIEAGFVPLSKDGSPMVADLSLIHI